MGTPVPVASAAEQLSDTSPITLQELEADVAAAIMLKLAPRDVLACAAASTRLRGVAHDEQRIWRRFCERDFAQLTDVSQWCSSGSCSAAASPSHSSSGWLGGSSSKPSTYRALYPLLAKHASLVGLWQEVLPGPRGSLFSFAWGSDCVEVSQLLPSKVPLLGVTHKPLFKLGPGYPTHSAQLSGDGDGHCVISEQRCSPYKGNWAAAEAAAAVAAGGADARSGLMGSSPPNSFGYELLKFMHSNVQQRRRSRSSSGNAGGEPARRHFTRVHVPRSTRQHPLAGLWKGAYGPHGLEMMAVSYDFSGASARIVCTKLTGDPNVPAGEVSWHAAAAPIPQPWCDTDTTMIQFRPLLAAIAEAAAQVWQNGPHGAAEALALAAFAVNAVELEDPGAGAAAGQGAAAAQAQQQGQGQAGAQGGQGQQQAQQQGQQQQEGQEGGGAEGTDAGGAVRVVSCHKGKGRVASEGFREPRWLEGRLWQYSDGRIAFLWCGEEGGAEELGFLVEYSRLEV